MKKHLLILASAAAMIAAGCAKLDIKEISEDSSNIMSLVVKGMLESDPKVEYDSVIDEENGLVTVQIPYYMSDTEPIQADLTKMRVKASLPQGARFEPSIAGVHDLIEGFESTLVYASGKEKLYRFQAAYVKSSKAQLLSLVSTNQEVSVSITVSQPADPESKGVIHALRTPATEPALQTTLVTVSPWATVESEAYDSETGIYDLLQAKDLTVIAQDGTTRATYEVSFELPKTVDYGVGYLEALWGFQCYEDDPKGMSKDANRTMAVVGNYLILSNSDDFSKMPVYNRMTGEYLGNDFVNTTGIDAGRSIHAICTDDAGHLFAVAYTSTRDEDTSNDTVRGWLWKDGISNPPTSFLYASLNGSQYASFASGQQVDVYRTVRVKGDLTGDAVIATCSMYTPRPVFEFVVDGVLQSPAYVEWPNGSGIQVSMWNSCYVVPLNNDKDAMEYLWNSANFRLNNVYSKAGNGFGFLAPQSHYWNPSGLDIQTSYTYTANNWGIDAIEFNGARLVGVQNGYYSNTKTALGTSEYYQRLYVFDMGISPTNTTMRDGFIFDSREGNLIGDESKGGPVGTGFAITGMTSPASFVSGKTVLDNDCECGGVLFARGSDGLSVQVYMLTASNGIICYNLTSYDM